MSYITKIEVCKKNKDRVNVFIDEDFAFACSSEIIYYQGLKKGDNIETHKISNIVNEDNYIKCKSKALKHIEKSYKTEKQVYEYLITKEFDEKTISRVIAFMHEYSFVDDEKYAHMYFKDKIKKQGVKKIKFDLKKKGIEDNIIENVSMEYYSNEDEGLIINGEKKIMILLKSETDILNIKRKLYDHLSRKGYPSDSIKSCVNSLISRYEDSIVKQEEKSEEDNFQEAYKLAEKRYNILIKSESNNMKLKKKLYDFLLRKGYNYEMIKNITKEIFSL